MTPKEKRTTERDVSTLFSSRAFPGRPTVEEWTENPTVKTERGDRPLSTVGLAALRRLTSLISDIPEVRDACSPKEIAEEVFERYDTWVLSSRQPSGQEFTDDVLRALRAKVKVHELLIAIEGRSLRSALQNPVEEADPAQISNRGGKPHVRSPEYLIAVICMLAVILAMCVGLLAAWERK
jgi:hypothetical protein